MFKKTLLSLAISCSLLGVAPLASASTYLQQGETAISSGHINNAISLLQEAQQQAKTPQEHWLANIALAEAYIRAGRTQLAEPLLKQTYEDAKAQAPAGIVGEIEMRYGHLAAAEGESFEANDWYHKAQANALKANDLALAAAAAINSYKQDGSDSSLQSAEEYLAKLPSSEQRHQLLLSLGFEAKYQQNIQVAHAKFQEVLDHSHDSRILAQAYGYLGNLYEHQQRDLEALQLTEQALVNENTPDMHLEWSWQKARILAHQGNKAAALSSYRTAVNELQTIRADIPVLYHDGHSSFKETFAPMYLAYLDLLLQEAEKTPAQQQSAVQEAIDTWEQLKAVELQDYFRDACAVKQKANQANLESNTAILYPLLLENRLALILRTPKGLQAYSVAHTPTEIEHAVTTVTRQLLEGTPLKDNHILYDWLIRPIDAELQKQHIDTLVYIPDGALRKIPFSLLHDGEHYLVERYALVTVPGLSMVANPSATKARQDILLAGMSEPGPVVEELLDAGINLFEPPKEEKRSAGRGGRELHKRELYIREVTDPRTASLDRNLRASQLKEELALPGVSAELKTLSNLTQHPVLENTSFLLNDFKHNVNQGHSAVHIASHGYFSGDPKKSFIMAYDHLLNMEQLSELFQTEAFHDRPIELVTLSACQTAEGDDRSPLGLSGVVVQTGVKSAIGTLWPVADEAAKQFFSDFYEQYQQPGMTKAKAMQYSQKKLMQNKDLSHPAYWGPFVLVGEWH